jgi:hypothetical protein
MRFSSPGVAAMPDRRQIELHFQERFSGEAIEIEVDGGKVAAFSAKTRYQIGLAHVETISVLDNSKIKLRISDSFTEEFEPVKGITYYLVRKTDKRITVTPSHEMPKYM